MLELVDTNKCNPSDYFIILYFNNPRSKQWSFIKTLIISNFDYQEKDDVFFCFVKNKLEQLEKLTFILDRAKNWKGTFIFVNGKLIDSNQIDWLNCYIGKLKLGKGIENNCKCQLNIGYNTELTKVMYCDFPCGLYNRWNLYMLSDEEIKTFINTEAEQDGLNLCPFLIKILYLKENITKKKT